MALNDDNSIPVLGIGVGELSDAETERAVSAALEIGYRLIDTAAAYGNEAAVGRAIAASGIPRAEIFVTTKLATDDQGFQAAQDACKASLERLGLDYVDLYLIHWPGGDPGKYVDSWGGLMKLQAGRLRQVDRRLQLSRRGPVQRHRAVVRRTRDQPDRAASAAEPGRAARGQRRARHRHRGVRPAGRRPAAGQPDGRVGRRRQYGKTPAQVLIRWSLQLGNVVIPRSAIAGAHRRELRRVRLRAQRRAHGRAQRARRRHPLPAGPGDLHRHLGESGRLPPRRAAPPPTASSIGSA